MFVGRSNGKGGNLFFEFDAGEVTRMLLAAEKDKKTQVEFWQVKDGEKLTLKRVTLKAKRKTSVVREVAVIEAGGEDVGEFEYEEETPPADGE